MKKILAFILAGAMAVSFAACSGETTTAQPACSDVVKAVVSSQTEMEQTVECNSDTFEVYYSSYGITSDMLDDYSAVYTGGAYADEIAVFKAKTKEDAGKVKEALEARLEKRSKDFEGYAPEEEAKLAEAEVTAKGNYVMLIIVPDIDSADKAADSCF